MVLRMALSQQNIEENMENIKIVIIDRIMGEVRTQIETATRGRSTAVDESKAHKGAMESRYDTFKEEAQYVAGGYNAQLEGLNRTLTLLEAIKSHPMGGSMVSVCSIIEVKNLDDGVTDKYFLVPAGGGETYEVEEQKITAVNVSAPMARAFIGFVAGSEVRVKIQATAVKFRVISVT
jgi:transcription elongation GreA/GreB family factor